MVTLVTHLNLTAALLGATIAGRLLEIRQRRPREAQPVAHVAQLGGGAGVKPRLPGCTGHVLSLSPTTLQRFWKGHAGITLLQAGNRRGTDFLARDLTTRVGFECRSCVLPSQAWRVMPWTGLTLF